MKLDSIEALYKEKKDNEVIVVFGGDSNSDAFFEYTNAADAFEDVKFFHTTIEILKTATLVNVPDEENKTKVKENNKTVEEKEKQNYTNIIGTEKENNQTVNKTVIEKENNKIANVTEDENNININKTEEENKKSINNTVIENENIKTINGTEEENNNTVNEKEKGHDEKASEIEKEKVESGKPMLALFKNFDEKMNIFNKNFDARAISKFIDANYLLTILPITKTTVRSIFSSGKEGMFLFEKSNNDESSSTLEHYSKFAKDNKGSIAFFKVGMKGDFEKSFVNFLKIKDSDLPRIEILRTEDSSIARYVFNQKNYDDKSFEKFLNDFRENKIERFFKSEEKPQKQESPVVKVVGKTWKDLVIDNDKDVLVKFYAPWCGHCKELAPLYVELAEQMKSFETIVIAEIDATENDIPGISIKSFPTLKFFRSKSKNESIEFLGPRTVEEMMKFIKEKSTFSSELDFIYDDDKGRYEL